jgi:large subunit ribosomal protein L15
MRLGEIKLPKGARKRPKRIGRGEGSGHGKTCCRGHNGQKSRSGASIRPGYEGGQMPLYRRIPKYGFKNPFRTEYETVNVSDIETMVEDGATVGPEELKKLNLVRSNARLVKILGDGNISKKVTVRAHKFSRSAEEKITAAGGAVEVI